MLGWNFMKPIVIDIICWNCGKQKHAEVHRLPNMGYELVSAANVVGMVPYHDPKYGRILVFCDYDCAKKQITKSGYFRKYPLRMK